MKIKIKLNESFVTKRPGLVSRSRREGAPKFIVIHHTAMKCGSGCTYSVLKKKNSSTHYEVEKDGSIKQYVDPSRVAWHAGGGFNTRSIGIDITGFGGESPSAQKSALQALVTSLCQRFSIPQVVSPDGIKYKNDDEIISSGIGIVRHRNVRRGTACPGDFPMDILGTVSGKSVKIADSPAAEKEKKQLSIKTSARGWRKFKSQNPDFDFDTFYKDLDDYFEDQGGAEGVLSKHGKDRKLGPEHFMAWQWLQSAKADRAAGEGVLAEATFKKWNLIVS